MPGYLDMSRLFHGKNPYVIDLSQIYAASIMFASVQLHAVVYSYQNFLALVVSNVWKEIFMHVKTETMLVLQSSMI